MSSLKLWTYSVMVLLVSGCSTLPDDGWRVAHVDRILSAHERPATVGPTQDCRTLMPAEPAEQGWLLVHFRRPPNSVFRIVPAGINRDYEFGEQVYVNVSDCNELPRLSLSSSKVTFL